MSAQHQHVSVAIHVTDSVPLNGAESVESGARRERSHPALKVPALVAGPERPESRAVRHLATLIDDVVACLDGPPREEPLHAAVARCNAALEASLEAQREREVPRDPVLAARDELRRLAALLISVDSAEAALVMRQIRRVLGRFDARSGG